MAKFELEMQLTGLKVRIKGDRGDVPLITANVGQQIAGLLKPPADIVDGELPVKAVDVVQVMPPLSAQTPKNGESRRRSTARSGRIEAGAVGVEFTHDDGKWGVPLQSWNPKCKSLWLLRVVHEQGGPRELSSGEIAATFNKHFKASGTVRASNVARDLGKVKSGSDSLVVEDKSSKPFRWSLSMTGRKESDRLIEEARAATADASGSNS